VKGEDLPLQKGDFIAFCMGQVRSLSSKKLKEIDDAG
jgi:hypothetical protein